MIQPKLFDTNFVKKLLRQANFSTVNAQRDNFKLITAHKSLQVI